MIASCNFGGGIMHNEEKTFRFSMRKPFKYKNFLEEKERGK